jgi:cyclopropane-fatty-acyl-phospholipid synthase
MITRLANHLATHLATHLDAPALPLQTASAPRSARLVLRLLGSLRHGALTLVTPDGNSLRFGDQGAPVVLHLHSWRALTRALRAGDIGFAEAWIDGEWSTPDLTALLVLLARNRAQIDTLLYGSWWGSLGYRLRHLLRRNSRAGSRKNIHAHYDIGNAFYQLWLDPSMTYSAALFEDGVTGLEQAQEAKYRAVLDQLALQPGQRVLEIGCGWGGFAVLAARAAGAHVTGLTLSREQLAFARARVERAGLAGQVALELRDYRDSEGSYDAVASIEMFEAVGETYWDDYFACVARHLKPGGRACIQTIIIDEALFERYRRGTDFIQQYIFPGGMLPSPTAFAAHAARHGLEVVATRRFGLDYARTLAVWRQRFHARLDAVRALGLDQRFVRTWDFYLAYCEAGFLEHNTDVMHFTLRKTA